MVLASGTRLGAYEVLSDIVHRDLKPANVIVQTNGTVKVLVSAWQSRS